MLTEKEMQRYARHLSLAGFGQAAQQKLKQAHVVMVGAGGLGCPVLAYLAAAGVGTIDIYDGDVVSLSNLQRQILYSTEDIGQPKATIAAHKLQQLNPQICVNAFIHHITADNILQAIQAADLVIDGCDNLSVRYLLNDACVIAGKPLLFAAIHLFEGQMAILNGDMGNSTRSATYRCVFPALPPPALTPDCSTAGVLGVLPGVLGVLQATEAIKYLTGIGKSLVNQLLIVDLLTMDFQKMSVQRQDYALQKAQQAFEQNTYLSVASCTTNYINDVTYNELKSWYTTAKAFEIIDIREGYEVTTMLPQATHIPMAELLANPQIINTQTATVLYCQGGVRSRKVIEQLQSVMDCSQMYSLQGGIDATH